MAEAVTQLPAGAAADASSGEQETKLARRVGPVLLLFFIVGDILGGGIYALVGEVGAETGGAIWTGFLAAFILAALTACSYAELVSNYPRAAGAALYVNRAFKRPFVTFMIAFAVMASGITSASTLARGFGGDALAEFVDVRVIPVAIAFLIVVALVNMRGIAESVRLNAVLTCVEVGGLVLIVVIGVAALGDGGTDFGRNFEFKDGISPLFAVISGAGLAFYALIGFEDSVNIAEEVQTTEPQLPADTLRRTGVRRHPLHAGDPGRLRARPDRHAHGVERAAGQRSASRVRSASRRTCSPRSPCSRSRTER